jgi:DNA primase
LIQRWDDIAPWLVEPLFADGLLLRAFRALALGAGDLDAALVAADPEAREVIERAAVADVEQDPDAEVRNLINAAVRRELASARSLEQAAEWGEVRRLVEQLDDPISGLDSADRLLQWLGRRSEERT